MIDTSRYEGMIAETVAICGHDGEYVDAYLARPLGPGPHPGVVLFHHRPGWDQWYREATRRFAARGYLAISPDLYHRFGKGEPDDVAARVKAAGDVPDATVVGDGIGAVDFLRAQANCSGAIALFGTCSGGRHALLTACQGADVQAVVDCWGGRVVMAPDDLSPTYPVAPIDLTAQLPCPVLGLFGNDDRSPSPEQVDAHEAALEAHGKTYEFHRYDGAGHGFFYDDRPSAYRAEQALDGWARIWDFLDRTLPTEA
jgi:carboxymethylenebutenolidase